GGRVSPGGGSVFGSARLAKRGLDFDCHTFARSGDKVRPIGSAGDSAGGRSFRIEIHLRFFSGTLSPTSSKLSEFESSAGSDKVRDKVMDKVRDKIRSCSIYSWKCPSSRLGTRDA